MLVVVLTVTVLALCIFRKNFSKKSVANRNIEMKENDAYGNTQDIMTAANDNYAHSAEMKENAAYASNIDTKIINPAYSTHARDDNHTYAGISGVEDEHIRTNESYATNTDMAANPAYGAHTRDDDRTYAAIAGAEDKYTTSQPEYDYVINRRM